MVAVMVVMMMLMVMIMIMMIRTTPRHQVCTRTHARAHTPTCTTYTRLFIWHTHTHTRLPKLPGWGSRDMGSAFVNLSLFVSLFCGHMATAAYYHARSVGGSYVWVCWCLPVCMLLHHACACAWAWNPTDVGMLTLHSSLITRPHPHPTILVHLMPPFSPLHTHPPHHSLLPRPHPSF
jgi:hypothetical protein